MAYNKHTWVARQGVGLNKFIDQNGNRYEFTPSPDEVTQPGTPFSAEWMNEMEEQLAKAAVLSGEAVEGNFPVFNALGELINSGKGPNILQYVSDSMFQTIGGVEVPNFKIHSGIYTGDGTGQMLTDINAFKQNARQIMLGFTPSVLWIASSGASAILNYRQGSAAASGGTYYSLLEGDIFYVSPRSDEGKNYAGRIYSWIAW